MSDTDVAEILKLPTEERLRLVELIWESLSLSPTAVPLSDFHRAVLDERLAEHDRSPDDVVSRDELAREILAANLDADGGNFIAQEARRQSILVSGRRSDSESLDFIEQAADRRGWK